ncbi:MAG: TIGR04100 family radical SAM protein [Thermoguttaceae bacterium]|nr:TIGR04100 family radical SAM protein [Thermoguttaceae bacterium]
MTKDLNFTYLVRNSVYINLTNRCPCSCTFCLRNNADGVFGSGSLWLEHEPTVEEVCQSLDSWKLDQYDEVVFCGYGEPTVRLDALLKIAQYIRSKSDVKIRINTNGLTDLIWKEKTASKLQGLVDVVSISLNASNKEKYLELTRSKFGINSYDAMLQFAQDCVKYVPKVVMTIVDVVTSPEEQKECEKICRERGITLRIRPYEP